MNLFDFRINLKGRGDTVTLIPLYDIHYGNSLCDVEALKRTVEKIKSTPNCYWFGGGDMTDCINMSDPRFDPKSVMLDPKALDNLVYQQINDLANILLPIKERCMFLLEGNHEEKVKKRYHINPVDIIAGMLKTKAYGYSAYGVLRISRGGSYKCVKIFAGHGWGSGRKIGGKINRLVEMGEFIAADIVYGGHSHGLIMDSEPSFDLSYKNKPFLVAEQRYFALGGTFLKTYDTNKNGHSSYGERAGYKPTPIGTVEALIKPFSQKYVGGEKRYIETTKIEMRVNSEV